MLKLYGVGRSRASRNLWFLHELGVPFDFVPVIQANRLPDPAAPDAPLNTRSPSFLAVSPLGMIPVLDDDGLILGESLAINLHLARRFGGTMGPADARELSLMEQGALFAAAALEPAALASLYLSAEPRAKTPEGAAELERHAGTLARPLAEVERVIAAKGHPVGGRFTVADVNLAEVLRYAQGHAANLAAFPATREWLAACQDRPAFKAMMAIRASEPA